jgi:hypothetical protein
MVDTPKMLKCNHCKRTVTEHAMPKHIERCLNKKQEKQRKKKEAKDARDAAARKEKGQESDEEEDGERSAVKGGAASKKRKAADEAEEGIPTKKKKKKDEAKAKASKPKAPVDVERQCGVDLPQGGQCARSLTCKSHSMGAKRAVAGRSAPYDKLLMEYQRKNAARQQKAAFDANAPDPEDDTVPSGPIDEQAGRGGSRRKLGWQTACGAKNAPFGKEVQPRSYQRLYQVRGTQHIRSCRQNEQRRRRTLWSNARSHGRRHGPDTFAKDQRGPWSEEHDPASKSESQHGFGNRCLRLNAEFLALQDC